MKSVWSTLMLSQPQLNRWQQGSYFRFVVGCLSNWRQGSWLFQWFDAIGACAIALVFLLAPFVSTSLIGVLLIAVAACWILNMVTASTKAIVTPVHILVFLYWCIATVSTAFSPVKSAAFNGWITLTLYLILFAYSAEILRLA